MEYTKKNPLRVFTAFSGYDSQCLALKRLGIPFTLTGWSEIDKYAIQAHDVLFPEYKDRNYGDISKIDWIEVPDFELFTYSFPCTNLSFAGKQEGFDEGSGTASSLLWECRKAIVEKKPKYLLMENVKALVSAKFKPLFMKWQKELALYGYTNFVKVLDSSQFGVPQHRERVFMVSILDENASYHFPEPFPLDKRLKDVLESNVDEKYYLSSKLLNYVFSNGGKDKNIRGGIGICDKDSDVSPTLTAQYYKSSRQPAYLKEEIAVVGNLYGDNKQAGRIYDVDGISPTFDNMASGGNKSPKIVEPNFGYQRLNELLKTQNIPLEEPVCIDTYNQCVKKGVFCTLKSDIDRESLKYVIKSLSCAMRGRKFDNLSDRSKGSVTGQMVEISDDVVNTITSVQKDSMVIEPKAIGYTRDDSEKVVKRILKDISNTIHTSTGSGGNTDCLVYEPQVLTPKRNEYGKSVRKEYESGKLDEIRHNMTDLTPREDGISNTITSVQKDNLLCEPRACNISYKITDNGKILAYQNDDKKSGVPVFQIDNEEAIASTVTTTHTPKCYGESMGFRIRKLTPREVFRLQDVDDEDIDELLNSGISNTRLYCMAGNSITIAPLYHIFRKLFIEKENENQQLTLF